MAISEQEVEKIAKLAKLTLSTEEKERFSHQLAEILGYMKKIEEVDTEGIAPTYHIHKITNVFREDFARSWLDQGEVLKNAPKRHMGYFSVPKVISKK